VDDSRLPAGEVSVSTARHIARRGFTLLEMMMVVAIVGVLSALAVVSLTTAMRSTTTSGEARRTLARIQLARSLATTTGLCHGVIIGGHAEMTGKFVDRVAVFREPTPPTLAAPCSDYNAMTAVILSNDFAGARSDTSDRLRASHLTWDVLQASPNFYLTIVFDTGTGTPQVFINGMAQPFAGTPARYNMIIRDHLVDSMPGVLTGNVTNRTISLSPTGSSVIL
jgi:prepilin-type N-terminal cleavage/methylation domain-containing protein